MEDEVGWSYEDKKRLVHRKSEQGSVHIYNDFKWKQAVKPLGFAIFETLPNDRVSDQSLQS